MTMTDQASTEQPAEADEGASADVENTAHAAAERSTTEESADQPKQAKKRRKKYSKGLRDIQRLERGLSKASHRMVSAVEKGMRTYRKRSEKSARKAKDGALRDSLVNVAVASSETLAESAKVPLDLMESVDTKRVWKRVRPVLRTLSRPIFLR
ncbi:MAG: hypothetical protein MPN21_15720 [Thermoanaerobaculia bacterium]|nr:hypothetical protein [Thermoanaerobaculia bacterium]